MRLRAALEAAKAAVWELSPEGKLYWDENFYQLVGLDPSETPPSTETFVAMIHPEDRPRLTEARRLMNEGEDPPRLDEYRLTRPTGETVWLENHRTRVQDGGTYFIGITQDVTRRKLAEERVQTLLQESDHRAKNQLAVVAAIARETNRAVADPSRFEEAFGARLQGLARSHDLMVKGDWKGTTLRELAFAHVEPFCALDRCNIDGPEVTLSAPAAQYLGMAFHELATNAVKYGALGVNGGSLELTWRLAGNGEHRTLHLDWRERGGPDVSGSHGKGFGSKVLHTLVPAALGGRSDRRFGSEGHDWTFEAPLAAVSERAPN